MVNVKVKKLNPEAIIPSYAHENDAGMDIYSIEDKTILPGERELISTGISMEIPEGYVALVWDKSGLAAKQGLKTMGGVIEHTYRGEYKIILFNSSNQEITILKNQKIAQILIQPIVSARLQEVDELSDTERGSKGFGSSGL